MKRVTPNQVPGSLNVGYGVKIPYYDLDSLHAIAIGEGTEIASFVEVGYGSRIGKFCKIESFSFLPPGTIIEDYVYIGPHVTVTSDRNPNAQSKNLKKEPVTIKKGASIGAGSIILAGVTIGENAIVGAGSIILRDVPAGTVIHDGKQV